MTNTAFYSSRRVVVLLQGLGTNGGVQRHSRVLCMALRDYAAHHKFALDVLSFTDPDGWYDPRVLSQPLRGCNGSRARFVAQALRLLARPHELVVAGQIDFGPIVLAGRLLWRGAPLLTKTYGIEVWRPLPLHKRLGLRAATKVSAISGYTAASLAALQGVDPAKVTLLPCTLDRGFVVDVATWQRSGTKGHPSRLLSIARLSRRDTAKGIDQVIGALPAVRRAVPNVSYTIVGEGDDRPRLEEWARACGVADCVHFVGRVPDAQLHNYLGGTDVFVLPSRKEGFGIVYLEAMAHGKPVIAGAHGGSPEVIAEGETGLLVQHGDVAALAAAISRLLRDPARRQAMGQAGQRRVRERFCYEYFAAALHHTLDELRAFAPQAVQP